MKHTDYRGYQQGDEVVQWFWKVRRSVSLAAKRSLTSFSLAGNQGVASREEESSPPVRHRHVEDPRQRL